MNKQTPKKIWLPGGAVAHTPGFESRTSDMRVKCARACVCVCVCDAQSLQSKLKLRGSTCLKILQFISETMSSNFEGPRWQADN